ncbi:MAG: integrase [Burkholderiaceae bacterium]|nr:MAG: integrase [Burkholderiaceae bacterium]
MEQSSTASTAYATPARYVRRLGAHHFAHLRAVADGIQVQDSARRYLGVEHGHQAKAAHQQTVDAVRAIARRRGEPAWRLVGLTIQVRAGASQPSLEGFIAERGLDGWSEAEVAEMYAEAYPADGRAARRERLRERQLELIRKIQGLAAEQPLASDLVSGWFDEVTAERVIGAGITTLGELNARVSAGGRWYGALPSIGEAKAARIEAHLATLLPREIAAPKPVFALVATPALFAGEMPPSSSPSPALPSSTLLHVGNDVEAVDAWIAARAGSTLTTTAYRREANRLLLWLQYERRGKILAQMDVGDCGDYMAFLQHIPPQWISRIRAAPGQPGWAPFRGTLSHQSQRQAIVIIASMFTWLQAAQYISANPWLLVNQKTGDDKTRKVLDSKALSEGAFREIMDFIEAQPPSPSRSRIRFILCFVEAVGLRSAELLNARLADLQLEPEGWVMQVHGKGAKNRIAAIPGQAFGALQEYLFARGLGGIETAPADAPLLASTLDPMSPVGYQALYEHVKSWISRAVSASALPTNERLKLAGATTHWLRHTFGTRAIARNVPLDVIQAQMGHASIQTTAGIYGRAPIKRRVDELEKAFT